MQKFIRHNARLLARNVVTNTICKLCKKSNDRLFLVVDSETLSENLSVRISHWGSSLNDHWESDERNAVHTMPSVLHNGLQSVEVQWSLHNVKNTLWNSHGKHRGACAPSTGLHTMHSDHYAIARCFTIAMHHKLWFTNSWTTNADSHYANHKLWFTISTHNEYKQPKNNITRIWS